MLSHGFKATYAATNAFSTRSNALTLRWITKPATLRAAADQSYTSMRFNCVPESLNKKTTTYTYVPHFVTINTS
ncbi:hypothetical protein ALQ78_101560 [Pseudomonas syringae pv. aptata]|nr:hypothetical protein ALQ78_101560 [Pseudomonas syringae pv. aptata]RMS23756.1 hypothetical protein ALP69_102033 [Pseudomonas syringae pv. aceris]RMS60816.1 hypothetical protein ALP63_102485 [Pseudomonas syringae pv. aceris]RMS61791.1 hypothetical protein ALP62_102484 [Pseudomonas syringae pv. aceris]